MSLEFSRAVRGGIPLRAILKRATVGVGSRAYTLLVDITSELVYAPGDIVSTGRSTARTGFLLCQGQSLERVGTYKNLYDAIGTTYGAADADHFSLPDIRGRTI